MRKPFAIVALALGLVVGYCAIPLRTVVSIIVRVEDQAGHPPARRASAAFLDGDGNLVVNIPWDTEFGWFHWWASSEYPDKSILTPEDAKRVRSVSIEADGCEPVTVPIELERSYQWPNPMPHGGGPAYILLQLERTVRLECSPKIE